MGFASTQYIMLFSSLHIFVDPTKLVLAGGCEKYTCTDEVQVLDVSGNEQSCPDAPKFPYEVSEALSFNINGYPWICGGTGNNGTGMTEVRM